MLKKRWCWWCCFYNDPYDETSYFDVETLDVVEVTEYKEIR